MTSQWDINDVCDTILRELSDRCPPANELRSAVDLAPMHVMAWLRENSGDHPTRMPYEAARRVALAIPFPYMRSGSSVRTIGDLLVLVGSMPSTRDNIDVRLEEAIVESMKNEKLPQAPMSDAVDNLRRDADKMRRLALDAIEIAETKDAMIKKIDVVIHDITTRLSRITIQDPALDAKLKSAKQARIKVEIQRIQTHKDAHDKTAQAVITNNFASQIAEGRRLSDRDYKAAPASAFDAAKLSAEGGLRLIREYTTDMETGINVDEHIYNVASYVRPLLEMYDGGKGNGAMEKLNARLFKLEQACLKCATEEASTPAHLQQCIATLHDIAAQAIVVMRSSTERTPVLDVLLSWQKMITSLAHRIQEEDSSAQVPDTLTAATNVNDVHYGGFGDTHRFIDFDPSNLVDVLNAEVSHNLGDVVRDAERMKNARMGFAAYNRETPTKFHHKKKKQKRLVFSACAPKSHY